MQQATVIVSATVIDEGKLLVVQEGKEFCRGLWSVPGGRVEPGERVLAAALREVFEETGYGISITGMTPVIRYISQNGFYCIRFNFVAAISGGAPAFDGEEILDLRWIDLDAFDQFPDDQLRTPGIVRNIVADARAGRIIPQTSSSMPSGSRNCRT